MRLSVIIPTRNPQWATFNDVLNAVSAGQRSSAVDEILIVDNGSTTPIDVSHACPGAKVISEPRPGLLWARLAGMRAAAGDVMLFLDDDTIPFQDSFVAALDFFRRRPRIGTVGGRVIPRYIGPVPSWIDEVAWALALRDWGPAEKEWFANGSPDLVNWSPIGAGLALRSTCRAEYEDHVRKHSEQIESASWKGQGMGGNEDKDLVYLLLRRGWGIGYCPSIYLTHAIPSFRTEYDYLRRLVFNLGRLSRRTRHAHGFNDLRPINPLTLPLRTVKSWWVFRAWRGRAQRLRWWSSLGHLHGLADVYRNPIVYPVPPPDKRMPGLSNR